MWILNLLYVAIMFMKKWGLLELAEFALQVEYGNEHDSYAEVVVKAGVIVGHVPIEHSQLFWSFITRGGCITCSITGRRKKGNGLEVPCIYQFLAKRSHLIK